MRWILSAIPSARAFCCLKVEPRPCLFGCAEKQAGYREIRIAAVKGVHRLDETERALALVEKPEVADEPRLLGQAEFAHQREPAFLPIGDLIRMPEGAVQYRDTPLKREQRLCRLRKSRNRDHVLGKKRRKHVDRPGAGVAAVVPQKFGAGQVGWKRPGGMDRAVVGVHDVDLVPSQEFDDLHHRDRIAQRRE